MPASWGEAFAAIARQVKDLPGERIGAIAGNLCDAESMVALKDLMTALGSGNLDCRQDGARLDAGRRDFFVFNTTIAGIEEADALLIVGSNPRREAPILNARIRKRWLAGGFKVAAIGRPAELTYDVAWLGEDPSLLTALHDGSNDFAEHAEGREEADDHRRTGGSGPSRWQRPSWPHAGGWRQRPACWRSTGTASTCCTPPPPGWAP